MPTDHSAAIEVSAYRWVPDMARGFVKDMRVRWALEEIGLPYRVRLFGGAGGEKSAEHIADQPFGQVPVLREGDLTLFESGAILIHLGHKDERLLPRDPDARMRAIGWVFAALNSVEPFLQALLLLGFAGEGEDWQASAKDKARPYAEKRLQQLSDVLENRDWLEDCFTIGDLAMADVLRAAPEDQLVAAHPNLATYVARATARPAFKAAMAAQLADFDPDPG
ncbi:MAG: glutathione S-transferase family protein [Sphingomonadaceae bacterium]